MVLEKNIDHKSVWSIAVGDKFISSSTNVEASNILDSKPLSDDFVHSLSHVSSSAPSIPTSITNIKKLISLSLRVDTGISGGSSINEKQITVGILNKRKESGETSPSESVTENSNDEIEPLSVSPTARLRINSLSISPSSRLDSLNDSSPTSRYIFFVLFFFTPKLYLSGIIIINIYYSYHIIIIIMIIIIWVKYFG